MAIAYHIHQFDIPTASDAETSAGLISDKVVVPSGLASVLANYVTSTALTTTLADYALTASIGVTIQGYDADLAAIAALTSAADKVPYATGAGTWALADFTSAGRALMDDADAAAQRITLGLGTAATTDAAAYATAAQGATADTAIQPGDPELVPAGGTTGQVLAKASNADLDTEWTAAGVGDMLAATYDPQAIVGDAFDRANHTGEQAISTVTGLTDALDGKQADLGWEPIQIVSVSSGSSIILAMPAGTKSLRLTGKIKLSTTSDAAILRFSVDGGATYFSTSGQYTQGFQINTSSATVTAHAAATAFTLAASNVDSSTATQFSAMLDWGNSLPLFSVENTYINGKRFTYGQSAATSSDITHVQITPTGSATFVAGTRFLAEAF